MAQQTDGQDWQNVTYKCLSIIVKRLHKPQHSYSVDHNPMPRLLLPKRFLITHTEEAWSRQVGRME